MSVRDLLLSLSAPAILVCLSAIFFRRKLYREFPSFFFYIVYALAASLRAFVGNKPLWHFVAYWLTDAIYSVLGLLVLCEVFYRIFSLKHAVYWWFRLLLPITIFGIANGLFWRALHYRWPQGLLPRLSARIYWFDMGVNALEGTILLLILVLTAIFSMRWKQYEFGILAGFGVSAGVTMAADLLVLAHGHAHETFFRYGPPLAYLFATLVWLHAFWRPPELTRHAGQLAGLEEEMGGWRRSLSRIRRGLRLRGTASPRQFRQVLPNTFYFRKLEQNYFLVLGGLVLWHIRLLDSGSPMGKDAILLIMLAEAIGLAGIYFLLKHLAQFSKRSLDDVPEFLRHINHEAVEKLFDPEEEREALAFSNSRRAQRCRLELAREYVQNLQHNATVVCQWGETEWSDMVPHDLEYGDETRAKILALHQEAVNFLMACRLVRIKIWFWSLLHFDRWALLPLPNVAALRRPRSIDLLEGYQRVKEAAAALAFIYGEEHSKDIEMLM